jgi:hypothetical protein
VKTAAAVDLNVLGALDENAEAGAHERLRRRQAGRESIPRHVHFHEDEACYLLAVAKTFYCGEQVIEAGERGSSLRRSTTAFQANLRASTRRWFRAVRDVLPKRHTIAPRWLEQSS